MNPGVECTVQSLRTIGSEEHGAFEVLEDSKER